MKKSSMSLNQQRLYDRLLRMDVAITGVVPIKMAAKMAQCWRDVGRELQFSERELLDCETRAGGMFIHSSCTCEQLLLLCALLVTSAFGSLSLLVVYLNLVSRDLYVIST